MYHSLSLQADHRSLIHAYKTQTIIITDFLDKPVPEVWFEGIDRLNDINVMERLVDLGNKTAALRTG